MLAVKKDAKRSSYGLLTIFIIVFFSQDTLLFGSNSNTFMFWLKNMVLLITCTYWIMKAVINKSVTVGKEDFLIFVLLSLFSLITMILSGDEPIKYFFEIMSFATALFVSAQLELRTFQENYIRCMLCIATFSLLVSIVYFIAYPVLDIFPVLVNKSGYRFHNLFLSLAMAKTPYVPYRNFGIFREPGIFSIFLVIALVFELFGNIRIKPKRLVIFVITIISTLSTAGYILLAMVFGIFLLLGSYYAKHQKIKWLFAISMCAAALLILTSETIFKNVFGKMQIENTSTNSRLGSVSINLHVFVDSIKNILVGSGYEYIEQNFETISFIRNIATGDNTNTILKMLAVHGLLYTSICCSMICRFWRNLSQQRFLIIPLCLIFVIALSNEDIIFNLILYLFVFYGVKDKRLQRSFA